MCAKFSDSGCWGSADLNPGIGRRWFNVIIRVVAKVIDVNPHLNTEAKRKAALIRFVIQSSAIEGIQVTEQDLSAEWPKTSSPAKKGQRRIA